MSIRSLWRDGHVLTDYTATMQKPLQSRNIRSVRIGSQCTTINLEDAFWERFRLISVVNDIPISRLLAEIDRTYRLEPRIPGKRRVRSLSSAVRIFVFEQMEAAASDDAIDRALAIAANAQIIRTPA
jgi:predicted DNA-binding ribbon-helix-helix protein